MSQLFTETKFETAVKTIPATIAFDKFTNVDHRLDADETENYNDGYEYYDDDYAYDYQYIYDDEIEETPRTSRVSDQTILNGVNPLDKVEGKSRPVTNPDPIQSSLNQVEDYNIVEIQPTLPLQKAVLPDHQDHSAQQKLLQSFGLTPDQFLQVLQNKLSGLGLDARGVQPELVTDTTPVVRTETAYETNTIKLFHNDDTFLTTVTRPLGLTTITDFVYNTKVVINPRAIKPLPSGVDILEQPDIQNL
jgi:hypothetical protein